jgi:hypothetical protein
MEGVPTAGSRETSCSQEQTRNGPRSQQGTLRTQLFDWSEPGARLADHTDVVIACDVLYEDFSVADVEETTSALLGGAADGRLIVADPVWQVAPIQECVCGSRGRVRRPSPDVAHHH